MLFEAMIIRILCAKNYEDRFKNATVSGVFKGGLVRAPPPFGRTAVIFVTILGLF